MTPLTGVDNMDDPTLGEIYRAVLRVEEQTIRTSGRLSVVEQQNARTDERVQVLERAHENCPIIRPRLASEPVAAAPLIPEGMDLKRFAVMIAVVGGAVWVGMDMLFKIGDWLRKAGIR
jgi:hypothetical protein